MPAPVAPAPPMPSPPPGVTVVGLKPPKPPPPPKGEIKLGKPSGQPDQPPAPNPAREAVFKSLRAKAGMVEEPEAPAAPPAAPERPPGMEDIPPGEQPPEAPEAPEVPASDETPPAKPEAPETDKGKKISPWKLVDQYKAKLAELEKKLVEKGALPEEEKKKFSAEIEQLKKRNAELEDEMRFVDFSKSEEFKTNFDVPYQKAWQRAVSEMAELTIADGTGRERPVAPQDILELVNMPLKKAREWANDKFGDFADDAMQHRKEIKTLFAAREQALTDAKAKGADREKAKQEAFSKESAETTEFIKQTWIQANEAVLKMPAVAKYFTPTEGDEEGNQQLQKGFALVDQGFSEFAKLGDKSLSREEKATIIKRHVAIRNRAAAFGRLVSSLTKAHKQIEAMAAELKQFKGSQPPSSPSAPAPSGETAPASARDQVFGALRKLAH